MKKMKKLLATVLVFLLTVSILSVGVLPSMTASAILYPGVTGLSRRAAAEGIVLLQNEDNALPIKSTDKVSLFGRIQVDYFACGYGSGGDVKFPYTTSLLTGMRRNPKINLNENLAGIYEAWCAKNPPNHGSWGNWPMYHPEMPLTDAIVDGAKAVSDTAVVVIGRSAGEDRESTLTKGSYYLTDLEVEMLNKVTAKFDKVIVVLNVGNIIDMAWLDNYTGKIDSLLYAWQGGMESGSAVADVLSGDETPSGKMAATIAKTRADYPSAANFGASAYTNYVDDIFVGYRYFETFEEGKDKVKYPFGFGLSYTTFDITTTRVATVGDFVEVDVTVRNTGNVKGKEVVQVYYGAPQGLLGKAAKSLVAYAKTNLIQPGGSENIKLSFKADAMASYDDAGKTGKKSAWVMEAGTYPIYVGNSVRASLKKGEYTEAALRVVEQLSEASAIYPAANAFYRWTASQGPNDTITLNRGMDLTPVRSFDLGQKILAEMPADKPHSQGGKGIKLIDVYNGTKTMDDFISQMTPAQLCDLTRGAGAMGHSYGIPGNASVYGAVTTDLKNFGIPSMSSTDGPSGIRMTAAATLLPIGTTLACTWNDKLVEELYAGVGAEMVLNGSDALLAPGMNIQRDPLCGRNFEYFSEDPMLTGRMGSATVKGVQSQGVSATPKHFACNNQETSRNTTDSRVSERAQREIYLRAFEICVKDSEPMNIMMSYNKINSVWAHYNYELATVVLRQQWGFKGLIMTDWWMQNGTSPEFPNITTNAYRVRAGVDVLMPGENSTTGNPLTAYQNGYLNIGEIQRSAVNTLNFCMKSARFRQDNGLALYDYQIPAKQSFFVTQPTQSRPELADIKIDGNSIASFASATTEYVFFRSDLTSFPTVTATGKAGVTVQVTPAAAGAPYATLLAKSADGGETIYRVLWSNAAGLPVTDPNPVYAYATGIYVNGAKKMDFYKDLLSYTQWVTDPSNVTITADVPAGRNASVTRSGDVFTVRVESPHQAVEYKITLEYPAAQVLPQSDEFNAGSLSSFWTEGGKTDKGTKEDGYYQIVSENGDWYTSGTGQKNYVWQRADGNWTSITKVAYDIKPYQSYHQCGVQVYQDENNFLQFVLEYNNWDGLQTRPFQFAVKNETAGSNSATTNKDVAEALATKTSNGAAEFLMRVTKNANVYTFAVSIDDGATWVSVGGNFTKAMTQPKFSLLTLKGATGGTMAPNDITVKYDYVRFSNVIETPVTPPAAVPVVDIAASGSSRLRTAVTYFYITGTSSSGLRTESCTDSSDTPPSGVSKRNIGYTEGGLYTLYNINVAEAGYYNVTARMSSGESNSGIQIAFGLLLDGERIATFNRGGPTGGWQNWITLPAQLVYLPAGAHKLMFRCDTGGFNMHYFDFARNTVDRSALEDKIEAAEAVQQGGYAASRWGAFKSAIQTAKTALYTAAATAQDIANAVTALQGAIDALNLDVAIAQSEAGITAIGGTTQLTANVTPETALVKTVVWSSSNTAVASVDANGKVTARSVGTATITAATTDGVKSDTCVVTVGASATVKVATGEIFSVPITLENCNKFSGLMGGKIAYDDSLLTLQSLTAAKGFLLTGDEGSFVALTANGMGVSGNVVIGYAVFAAKADLLYDAVTDITFPFDGVTAFEETLAPVAPVASIVNITIRGVPPMPGDVSLDGAVDLSDAIMLMQYLAGSRTLDERQLKAADVNKDGKVNVGDVTIIMQMCLN